MGEFLKAMPKNEGALKRGPVVPDGNHGEPTLASIGITKKQSHVAQKLAEIPEDEFKARVALAKTDGGRLSTAKVFELAPRAKSAGEEAARKSWNYIAARHRGGIFNSGECRAQISAVRCQQPSYPAHE